MNYIISKKDYYTEIRNSSFDQEQNCLRIEYMSDGPSEEDLREFIKKKYPEQKNKEILKIYYDKAWLSDWNMGSPQGCFGLIIVFFKG